MNCVLDDIESINVKFLRYRNGILVMQEMLLYLGVQSKVFRDKMSAT